MDALYIILHNTDLYTINLKMYFHHIHNQSYGLYRLSCDHYQNFCSSVRLWVLNNGYQWNIWDITISRKLYLVYMPFHVVFFLSLFFWLIHTSYNFTICEFRFWIVFKGLSSIINIFIYSRKQAMGRIITINYFFLWNNWYCRI